MTHLKLFVVEKKRNIWIKNKKFTIKILMGLTSSNKRFKCKLIIATFLANITDCFDFSSCFIVTPIIN